ncbi:hypothetical protein AB205_0034990, partial [Aquarana catesbeiana]
MNAKFKEPEFLLAFIDQYREMRNLWEVKHPRYYLKHARKSTLERLLTFVQTYIPEATMEMLLKIGILRNMYKRKHNKIQNSMRSGASADYVYVPRLWYYNTLRFLDDQTEVRASLSTLPSTLPCTLPCTLPSTPAEADEDQAGSSILEELDVTIWSQDEVSQEESGSQEEAGPRYSQEEAGPCVIREEAGPCVIREEAGPCVIREEAGPCVRQ